MPALPLRSSLLDRLLGDGPDAPAALPVVRAAYRQEMAESLRRDLEHLLGTRCPTSPDELSRSGRTVHDYGMPDAAHLNPTSPEDCRRIAAAIKATIDTFEPRLQRVRVTATAAPATARTLHVRVEGVMGAEPVSFPFVVTP